MTPFEQIIYNIIINVESICNFNLTPNEISTIIYCCKLDFQQNPEFWRKALLTDINKKSIINKSLSKILLSPKVGDWVTITKTNSNNTFKIGDEAHIIALGLKPGVIFCRQEKYSEIFCLAPKEYKKTKK